MTIDEIYDLINFADATRDKALIEQAKQEIDRLAEKMTELYDTYYYVSINI